MGYAMGVPALYWLGPASTAVAIPTAAAFCGYGAARIAVAAAVLREAVHAQAENEPKELQRCA